MQRAGVELAGAEQQFLRGDGGRLAQCPVRVRDARRGQDLAEDLVGQPLQAAQDVRRAGRGGQRGQRLVQGGLVTAAGAREQPQAADLGEQRRELGPPGPGTEGQGTGGVQRGADHPGADERVTGVALAALRLGRDHGGRGGGAAVGERALDERMCGQDTAVAAEGGREGEVREAGEAGVVLDEGGLGGGDVDGGGAGGDIL
ncbi:hypothetical protein B0E37_06248 [Streptomyces sp. MH192]|nr:hypothetical protein [Streptomyces sp. MH192]